MHDPKSRTIEKAPGGLTRWAARRILRTSLTAHWIVTRLLRSLRSRRRPAPGRPLDVLLTGTFHSNHWIAAHLVPLAASPLCARVRMVATAPVPDIPKVTAVYPPRWLRRLIGSVGARLLTFAWTALRDTPDVAGGFHLLINGLVAQVVAAASGGRSLYFCVGGPTEFAGGGFAGENEYFARLGVADPVVERQLLRAAMQFDDIVTMGTKAAAFFIERRPWGRVHVISGAIDPERFHPALGTPEFDVIFVGRIVSIKRVDRLIRALALASRDMPALRAVLVGDGPQRAHMEALARTLGIEERVTFAGNQHDVAPWLQRARVFMLTSASEGVALSLMEATVCGLPAIVPGVGDLEDVVTDGVNGLVVRPATEERLASALVHLLTAPGVYQTYRDAAIATCARFTPIEVAALWAPVLAMEPHPAVEGAGSRRASATV